MWLRATDPDLAVPGSVAEHDGAVSALGRDLEEVWHELRVLAQVDTTEAGNAASTMGMDVEQRNTVLHSPLQGATDRGGSHHCGDARIIQVFVIAHGAILACEHQYVVAGSGQAR